MKKHHVIRLSLLALACLSLSCAQLKGLKDALTNLQRCSFKLDSVNGFELMGVGLSSKKSVSDFSVRDGAKLVSGFAKGSFPASFTLNVAAINPNDGQGGRSQASATLTSFAWTMLIDNTITISGDITEPITIPGTGQQSIIPLKMNLDLAQFFRDNGYDHVVNLALALGGVNGSPSRITLKAKPRLHTDFGDIMYPGEISIIDKEFRGQ
ncbi:MAG: hypothetical protein HY962_05745 [Ignavibacteriae bacterium]|nr:hypothetical protein [Ignavibacteriota bacterium]